MAPRCLDFCMVMGLILVVAIAPGAVEGSSRRLFNQRNGAGAAKADGICKALVTVHGYKCQEIDVTTDDGYILNLQRIPEGRNGRGGAGKPPVIIQHGILLDATTFLLNSPDENLPMILADNGYDVWLANTRGTRFSRRHTSLDSSDPKYWDWTWDEMVAHDLPAVFNYVHGKTKQKINYIGHSLGTLTMLAALSEGQLEDQLKSVALLTPIAFLKHVKTPIFRVGARIFAVEISRKVGFAEFDPKGALVGEFLDFLCATPGFPSCYDIFSVLTGKNCCLNASTMDLFLEHQPQSTSTKNMAHLSQLVRTSIMAKYDYGEQNVLHYGSKYPPRYDISKIPKYLPMFMSYGGQDAISDPLDVKELVRRLKPRKGKLVVHFVPDYAHNDFVMGTNAKDRVYNKLISFIKQQRQ